MPYKQKVVKMASEPVAFHLYKSRHFHQFDLAKSNSKSDLEEEFDSKDTRF
jgi:hypothetical protein